MSLWHRAPREVYRVYGEEQYLEGEPGSDPETAVTDGATGAEPDRRAGASWKTVAAEFPADSPVTGAGSSARADRPHAGRLLGVGLLVGVGLATLALVFLNVSRRQQSASGLAGQDTHTGAARKAAHTAPAASDSTFARRRSNSATTHGYSASTALEPGRESRLRRNREASMIHRPDSSRRGGHVSPMRRAVKTSGTLQSPTPVVVEALSHAVQRPAPGDIEEATSVATGPSMQDEFGFER